MEQPSCLPLHAMQSDALHINKYLLSVFISREIILTNLSFKTYMYTYKHIKFWNLEFYM